MAKNQKQETKTLIVLFLGGWSLPENPMELMKEYFSWNCLTVRWYFFSKLRNYIIGGSLESP